VTSLSLVLQETLGIFRSNDTTATRKSKINKQTIDSQCKTTTVHVHHTFLYISLPFLLDYDVELPNFAFLMENVNKQRRNFISLSEPGYGAEEFIYSLVRKDLTK